MNEADARRTAPKAARPPRPMRADARRNYERLLAVATEAFSESGANASLDDIAKRAEVGPGTLYRHFPTRQDLLEAVMEQWMQSVLAEAEPLLDSADPAEALAVWLQRLISHVAVFRGLAAATLLPSGAKDQSPGRVLHTTAEELLTRAQRSGQIRTDVTVIEVLTLVSGITWACDSGKPVNPVRLVELVMDGLRTHPALPVGPAPAAT
ncbi:TetR/AcrR family transcriptional regulator [Streptacidiphilus sp. P02-A3a]|uniref:TetR/AcrR family transcriptional regulator n=1 Tax=Streptacidiphilus sp. P02-A3a TaxID=2704468 RepID=UPI0015FB32B3|nr:TetR/AcrR family transcriptional regulator [Streptacidiphilus sp. P02-A3a]QMU68553.1 TetR/AcrR family transcriptional regulator [Streptacidiphilus sp. P02-A3a]